MAMLCQVREIDFLDAASREAPARAAANVLRGQRLDVVVAIRANIHSPARTALVWSHGIAQRKRRALDHDLRYFRRRRIHETMNWQTLIKERLGIVPIAALSLYYPIANGAKELRQLRCLHRLPLAVVRDYCRLNQISRQ